MYNVQHTPKQKKNNSCNTIYFYAVHTASYIFSSSKQQEEAFAAKWGEKSFNKCLAKRLVIISQFSFNWLSTWSSNLIKIAISIFAMSPTSRLIKALQLISSKIYECCQFLRGIEDDFELAPHRQEGTGQGTLMCLYRSPWPDCSDAPLTWVRTNSLSYRCWETQIRERAPDKIQQTPLYWHKRYSTSKPNTTREGLPDSRFFIQNPGLRNVECCNWR